MVAFLAWLKSRNITSHTVAVALIALAGLITSDEQVRTFLLQSLSAHPKIAADIILAAGIILKYSRGSSPVGAVGNVLADVKQDGAVTDIPASVAPANPTKP
jgi:hypothetical protein